jgi:hypothetical protein
MDSTNRISLNGQAKSNSPSEDERRVKVADVLTKKFDELNRRWTLAEAELRKIPLPVDVWVFLSKDIADDCVTVVGGTSLGFAKSKGGWRICLGYERYEGPGVVENLGPIVEASLDSRMEAVRVLPELRAAVLKEAEQSVARLDNVLKDFA